jgi:uncharacterized protein (DUF849 family)
MDHKDKVILTCAVTGAIHTPSMTPYLPITPDQITEAALGAAAAGASILHLHARDPNDGRPSCTPEHFMGFLPQIAQGCDAVVNLSTGGSATMPLELRLAGPLAARPEMCSLNMGTMNFALYPMAERITDWRFDWEEPFLRGTDDLVFKNTPRDIESILRLMGQERGARFEFECYDTGHLGMLAHFRDRGLIEGPIFLQFVFGVLGGMAPLAENLTHMKRLADRYFGSDYHFSVLAAGRYQMPFATMAAGMGGHVRVGLEDCLTIARGQLARSNAEQVEKVRALVEGLGREVATPAEVRSMLGLKGPDRVGF